MVSHKNFYETINEARMRLRNTIVKYKDDFFYVLDVSNHMADGKFRVYMDPVGYGRVGRDRHPNYPGNNEYPGDNMGEKLDKFLENYPDSGIVRKFADSRHFEKFRPFPLGNVNMNTGVVYTERTPTRNMHQGLLHEAIMATNVESVPAKYDPNSRKTSIILNKPINNTHIDSIGPEFYDMLMGLYPSYGEVVSNLRNPDVLNRGVAFHRDYSIMRGPIDTLLLCHKHSGVGIIDNDDSVTIGTTHEFLREELEELGVFSTIKIKEVKNNV